METQTGKPLIIHIPRAPALALEDVSAVSERNDLPDAGRAPHRHNLWSFAGGGKPKVIRYPMLGGRITAPTTFFFWPMNRITAGKVDVGSRPHHHRSASMQGVCSRLF